MKSNTEIAGLVKLRNIKTIANKLGIPLSFIIPYGSHIAKINSLLLKKLSCKKGGKLILVTAMSPTPEGEGKTTLTIGIAQSLKLLKKEVIACIRQPSLGPFLGMKGGATGSGYSQVAPAEDITLHFTGDDHAVASTHNLIASIIDNHIHHSNKLRINPARVLWKRVSDINDRALRRVKVSAGDKNERDDGFYISAASEIMSILCLSQDITELKKRLWETILAFDSGGNPVFLKDLKIGGAAIALLKNAFHPNLVQSIEGVPVFVHGGPFGNVSIGCNSLIATMLSIKLSDYVLTEAGFSTELGAEKFFDIKCRVGRLKPSAVVIVATLKALRLQGGAKNYKTKDINSAINGLRNLEKHIENINKFGIPLLVAINRFETDTADELKAIITALEGKGVSAFTADVRNQGGKGGLAIAKELVKLCRAKNNFNYLYPLNLPVKEKIATIAREMYGADGALFTGEAEADIKTMEALGYSNLPVCVAKTPKSLSDDAALLGRPENFRITVQRVFPATGAGFLVAVCGNILLMPGFPEHPLAERIEVDEEGNIIGL